MLRCLFTIFILTSCLRFSVGQESNDTLPTLNIDKAGYLYVYVSNESNNSQDVYFDDLRITPPPHPRL